MIPDQNLHAILEDIPFLLWGRSLPNTQPLKVAFPPPSIVVLFVFVVNLCHGWLLSRFCLSKPVKFSVSLIEALKAASTPWFWVCLFGLEGQILGSVAGWDK